MSPLKGRPTKIRTEQKKKENASAREPSIGDRTFGVALAQAGMPVLLENKRAGETPAVRTANSKMPGRRQRYEPQMCKQVGIKSEGENLGRYVYDSGGADLGCGVAMSDYDVRSSRCSLACPGCVLDAG
jgi:hypothetical protein